MKCKYCGKVLPPSNTEKGSTYCSACGGKLMLIKEFIKECEEFKRIIGYDEILKCRGQNDG